jgi:hypothetical protein
MNFWLWDKLPDGLLKMRQRRWSKLDYEVKLLINGLAHKQGFKCAHCSQDRGLVIEHDHYPEHGPGDKYTIYNIRGLVCVPCNWHIGMYEAEERGEIPNWPDRFPRVSESQYYEYIDTYECRVHPLLETMREEQLGTVVYWRRRNLLFKLDDWIEWQGKNKKRYPWHWGFDEIKDKKYGYFRTNKQTIQFLRTLTACIQYVVEHPEYEPPDEFFEVIFWIKPLLESVRPIVEAKLSAMGRGEDVKSISGPASSHVGS